MSRSGNQIVGIARNELGKEDGPSPGRYSGNDSNWCSEFVSWIYKEAGYPFGQIIWLLKSTERIRDWFRKSSTYIEREDSDWNYFAPTPGDYVFIGRAGDSDRRHSGIVEYVDGNGGLHTIEGNNKGRAVDRYVYPNFRTNDSNNDPPETDGIVLGFGLRCGMQIRLPNGNASASSSGDNREPYKAFDGDRLTWWRNRTRRINPQYLQMEWNEPQTITKISLRFGGHYPEKYQFMFKTGSSKNLSVWQWSTIIVDNNRRVRSHVWFTPMRDVWAVRLRCLDYSKDDYFSVVDMSIQK